MTAVVQYTDDDRRLLQELHATIVGTGKDPGLGEQHRTLRREFDEHAAAVMDRHSAAIAAASLKQGGAA